MREPTVILVLHLIELQRRRGPSSEWGGNVNTTVLALRAAAVEPEIRLAGVSADASVAFYVVEAETGSVAALVEKLSGRLVPDYSVRIRSYVNPKDFELA